MINHIYEKGWGIWRVDGKDERKKLCKSRFLMIYSDLDII